MQKQFGWEKRYLTLKEAQKLQGFETISLLIQEALAISSLGNSVNTKVVENIIKQISPIEINSFSKYEKQQDVLIKDFCQIYK